MGTNGYMVPELCLYPCVHTEGTLCHVNCLLFVCVYLFVFVYLFGDENFNLKVLFVCLLVC